MGILLIVNSFGQVFLVYSFAEYGFFQPMNMGFSSEILHSLIFHCVSIEFFIIFVIFIHL